MKLYIYILYLDIIVFCSSNVPVEFSAPDGPVYIILYWIYIILYINVIYNIIYIIFYIYKVLYIYIYAYYQGDTAGCRQSRLTELSRLTT